jgi:F0F1-type ATP synthase assembly protein I
MMAEDRDQNGQEPDPGRSTPEPRIVDLFALGMACAVAVILAGGIGYLLDNWLGTLPILTFVGLAFGVTSAVLLAVARVRKYL